VGGGEVREDEQVKEDKTPRRFTSDHRHHFELILISFIVIVHILFLRI